MKHARYTVDNNRIAAIFAVCIVVLLIAIFFALSARMAPSAETDDEAYDEQAQELALVPVEETHEATMDELRDLRTKPGLFAFSLSNPDSSEDVLPTISDEFRREIGDAAKLYKDEEPGYSFGFILLDVENGRGYGYNIDKEFYAASSIKAPFAAFLCEELLETGHANLDDMEYFFTGGETLEEMVSLAIVDSDNTAYEALRRLYSYDEAFTDWIESLGFDAGDYTENEWYPYYSVRDAAIFWIDIWEYLESDTGYSEWLAGLLEETNLSVIREAVDDRKALILNKAGWIIDYGLESIVDNGLIYKDGHVYLMCIATDSPYTDANLYSLVDLAATILDEAGNLDEHAWRPVQAQEGQEL